MKKGEAPFDSHSPPPRAHRCPLFRPAPGAAFPRTQLKRPRLRGASRRAPRCARRPGGGVPRCAACAGCNPGLFAFRIISKLSAHAHTLDAGPRCANTHDFHTPGPLSPYYPPLLLALAAAAPRLCAPHGSRWQQQALPSCRPLFILPSRPPCRVVTSHHQLLCESTVLGTAHTCAQR